ncbi:MAG: ATP-binding protein [Saprospiraceae bacterium]|nr:ATP-binding protein [Saprospiraceae bacterium]MBK9723058.1 ATP-binding protein [Saprospiraceae bacterium]
MDEFHNFTTLSLVNMFSELRKFKVGMTLAHQYLNQLDDDIKSPVLGNAGTIISFRIGTEDALYDRAFPQIGGWSTIVLQMMEQCELR